MKRDNTAIIVIVIICVVVACCCLTIVGMGAGGFFAYRAVATEIAPMMTGVGPILTQVAATPRPPRPTITPHVMLTPLPADSQTLEIIKAEVIPQSNLRELAMRLKGVSDIPEVVGTEPATYQIGDTVEFNASNTDTDQNFKVTARLMYQTENVYFFVDEKVTGVKERDVKKLVDQFQTKTYPTNREFFGSEWTPGIDGDPHLYILYTQGLGMNVGGYYSSADEFSKLAHEYSNEKEMFYLNASAWTPLSDSYWEGALAHEFQHMIHWYQDSNEEGWMNEGSSMLAEDINGYETFGQYAFLGQPDMQLNTWSDSSTADFGAHYDASYLFMKYFRDQFGEEATRTLIADKDNGFEAVDNTLQALNLVDPETNQPLNAVDLFANWVVANYLNKPGIAGGKYGYKNYTDHVTEPTDVIGECPHSETTTVHQFAADYYQIVCEGPVTIDFTGSLAVPVAPTQPRGQYAFWSNRDDESDTTLTRAFDLSGLAEAHLKFQAWWSIEKDYDYVYLEISSDEGKTWKIIQTPSGTDKNPTGNNLGWGYTGNSDGGDPVDAPSTEWIEEAVDLSEYAGQKIMVRFEYVTDAMLNYPGFILDDISVPELDYATDLEQDEGGWDGAGFVRIDNLLPQVFAVQVIRQQGKNTTVTRLPLDAKNQGQLTLDLADGETATLVVSGATLFTTEEASYKFEIQ